MSTAISSRGAQSPWAERSSLDTFGAGRLATSLLSEALSGSGPVPSVQTSRLRVGVDVVEVADVVHSVGTFGDRYVRRIFTPHEIACCSVPELAPPAGSAAPSAAGVTPYSYESLAARFAAKEATIKVLHPEGPRPEWRSIEVHRAEGGWCELRLFGLAALLAQRSGLDQLAVSLTHEASIGAAVVVAVATGPLRHEDQRDLGEAVLSPPTTREE
jgi:holo-[acyl-carrier protein] synthase